MAKKPQIDVRKLKDEVTEHLKKSRWEKAAEVLEDLVGVEPKDMAQRLKLGDTYRRMDQPEKAIDSYQHAAKFFADEGQLIKAIGAVKMILELDPRNPEAQKQLAAMNERRMGKANLPPRPAVKPRPGGGARAPATDPIELEEPAAASESRQIELPPEDAPLELDDGMPGPPPTRARPVAEPAKPQPVSERHALELDVAATPAPPPPKLSRGAARRGAIAPPPPPAEEGIELDLDPDLPPQEPELLPDDAILGLQPEDLIAEPHDEDVIPGDEFGRQGGPIADLLSSGAEEEVELLSISADEEVAGVRPTESPSVPAEDEDLDAAFGNIAPPPGARKPQVSAKRVPLFDDLSQDAFVALVNRLGYHRHDPGQLIIREGVPGRSFYIIIEGRVRIYKNGEDGKEITLAHLGEGAFFGEMALLSGAPRTANVVAEEDTGILEVTDTVLRELASKYPQVVSSLKNFYRQRLLNNVMAISPLFKDFDPSQRKAIVEKFRMRQARADEVLIAEGQNSDGLYVVLHGVVQAMAKGMVLAQLKEGEIFGEMSLLTRDPASATVMAKGNAILLRLPRENFQELVVTHPQILALVSELSEKRRSAIDAILQGQGPGHDGMSFV